MLINRPPACVLLGGGVQMTCNVLICTYIYNNIMTVLHTLWDFYLLTCTYTSKLKLRTRKNNNNSH